MAPTQALRVAVVGGTGFLGFHICRQAISRGFEVVSISRKGEPINFYTPNNIRPSWVDKVSWISADSFDPTSYQQQLTSCHSVIHSVGTLFESSAYKHIANSRSISDFISSSAGFATEMMRGRQHTGEVSYERMNHDTALVVANTFIASRNEYNTSKPLSIPSSAFIYLSASAILPERILSMIGISRYVSSKREAEELISHMVAESEELRFVSLRPGLMYSPARPVTIPVAGVNSFARAVASLPLPIRLPSPPPPLDVHTVADAAVSAILKGSGIVECQELPMLAEDF
ncbi:hypothetical protein BKA69DRAFT_1122359 [Paraphysoderma sedebokerense]|nr:hypothetical protein BKA69DRAFT_1122359 [Paraphysoderma sedebokerense]